jgi:hypothetical protein
MKAKKTQDRDGKDPLGQVEKDQDISSIPVYLKIGFFVLLHLNTP